MAILLSPKEFELARTHLEMLDRSSLETVTLVCNATMVFRIRQQTRMCLVVAVGLSRCWRCMSSAFWMHVSALCLGPVLLTDLSQTSHTLCTLYPSPALKLVARRPRLCRSITAANHVPDVIQVGTMHVGCSACGMQRSRAWCGTPS